MDFLKEWKNNMKKNQMTKGLIIQTILLFVLIICMLLSIFVKIFLPIADFLAGIIFLIIAYNKKQEYPKFILIIFIILAILFMGFGIYNIINGL